MYLKDDITAKQVAQNYKNGDIEQKQYTRKQVRQMDSERFGKVLKNAHMHLSHADNPTKAKVQDLYTDDMLRWIGVYGLIEELNTFPKITGIEK